MASGPFVEFEDASVEVRAIYDDIRALRNPDSIQS